MVDIHSHIVFGVDDGSRTIEETLEMLAAAAQAGTTDIVGTPHAHPQYPFEPEVIADRVAQIRARCETPRVHTGSDFHLTFENVQDALANPGKYTINGGRYLLVEFSDGAIPAGMDDVLARLVEAGMVPIITHPERTLSLRHRPDLLQKWVGLGCQIQVTGLSLSGRFGKEVKKVSAGLMESGLVHYLASDAHDPVDRHARLDGTHALVTENWGAEIAETLLRENPTAAIENRSFEVKPRPKRRRWWVFG